MCRVLTRPLIHELKSNPSPNELATVYTPTREKTALADRVARGEIAHLGFLVLLKTFPAARLFHSTSRAGDHRAYRQHPRISRCARWFGRLRRVRNLPTACHRHSRSLKGEALWCRWAGCFGSSSPRRRSSERGSRRHYCGFRKFWRFNSGNSGAFP
jgi:hypothetical protein